MNPKKVAISRVRGSCSLGRANCGPRERVLLLVSREMRFPGRFCLLLVFLLTLGLICSEVPESLSLSDDTSNDIVTSTPAFKTERAQTARQEANPGQGATPVAAFPSHRVISCPQSALPSGLDLLRLLSIQRK